MQVKLATELQRLSQEFRKMQKDYLQRLKSQQDRGPGAAGVDSIDGYDGSRGGGGGGRDDEDYDPGFTDMQMQRGRAVQVDPIKPLLKPPVSMLLKLRYNGTLSMVAFNFNLRRYSAWTAPRLCLSSATRR